MNKSIKFDETLKERFFNTQKFSNHDNNKLISLLPKRVYLYKYWDDCVKSNETPLSKKDDFYSHLNKKTLLPMQITRKQKRVCKDFQIKSSREYHYLHVRSDTLLLANVFENFRKICLKIQVLDPAKFLSAPGLA